MTRGSRWAAAILVAFLMPVLGHASSSSLSVWMGGVGAPFDDLTGAYGQYYWSRAYAEAGDNLGYVTDDQSDPSGGPRPGVDSLTATATTGGASATARIVKGNVWFAASAMLLPGRAWAFGYPEAEHWVDFEVTGATLQVGAAFTAGYTLWADNPWETAYVDAGGWAELDRWVDDNHDGIRDASEWHELDSVGFGQNRSVTGIDLATWSGGDTYWFDPVGPGVYSLGFGGGGEVGVERIPAPGALLLGALGVGFIATGRRRGLL